MTSSQNIPDIDEKIYRRKYYDYYGSYGDPPLISVTCPYCNEKHPKNICNNPDVIEFSKYLLNSFKNSYQSDDRFEIKQEAAYNMLYEYSPQLLVASSLRISLPLCEYEKTFYGKKTVIIPKKI